MLLVWGLAFDGVVVVNPFENRPPAHSLHRTGIPETYWAEGKGATKKKKETCSPTFYAKSWASPFLTMAVAVLRVTKRMMLQLSGCYFRMVNGAVYLNEG